jgi:hypothetical protein
MARRKGLIIVTVLVAMLLLGVAAQRWTSNRFEWACHHLAGGLWIQPPPSIGSAHLRGTCHENAIR